MFSNNVASIALTTINGQELKDQFTIRQQLYSNPPLLNHSNISVVFSPCTPDYCTLVYSAIFIILFPPLTSFCFYSLNRKKKYFYKFSISSLTNFLFKLNYFVE